MAKADEANADEQKKIEALTRKLTGKKGGNLKLSKEELALAQKIDMEPKMAGRLLGKKEKSALAETLEAAKNPGKTAKGGAKAASSKAAGVVKRKAGDAVFKWF
jgi:hypothetical protein